MEMERIQIFVLKCLRKILRIAAHQSNWSAHLGRNKTLNRVIKHFYWIKIKKLYRIFVIHVMYASCYAKGKIPPKAPLIKVAIEDGPIRWVVVDLCGPLLACIETNNRFTFTAVETCTRYPITISLVRHTPVDIASAIINIFSTFGHNVELLSDKGSNISLMA